MKTQLMILALSCSLATAMGQDPPAAHDRPPEGSQSLTSEQTGQVKAILSKYQADTLTAADAKAIHRAFREAGLRNGPGLRKAMEESGFTPTRLGELDPPPEGRRPRSERSSVSSTSEQKAEQKAEQGAGQGAELATEQAARSPERRSGGPQKYCLEQAASDNAQLHTIAFSGLAFITGDFGAATFMPPGKVCDYFGFQYMRDIDVAQKGHNPKFLDRVAGNVLLILTPDQRAIFEASARQEAALLRELALKRLPLIKAFCRQLKGEIPAGSKGLSKEAVTEYVGDFFAFDADISYRRAQIFGQVATSLTSEQKAYLAKMKFGDFNSWPAVEMDKYKLPRGTEKMINVAYMTYASEFFSWYAGSLEADTYFCPERHGTYFGGFYMKDMPAMGKRDFDISTSVTGDSGREFIETLTADQRKNITAIPDLQRSALQEIIQTRRAMATELRRSLTGQTPDKSKVQALGRRYGQLDGQMSYYYAMAFGEVNRTLTAQQRAALVKLRNLPGYTSAPAYIYSDPVREELKIPDTDRFFRPAGAP